MKETDLYEPIKKWLNTKGFDVYAEVKSHGFRSDVIGKSGPALANVELKLQLSFDLLDQALSRKNFFNYTYIAIPRRKSIPRFVRRVLEKENIGLLQGGSVKRIALAGSGGSIQDASCWSRKSKQKRNQGSKVCLQTSAAVGPIRKRSVNNKGGENLKITEEDKPYIAEVLAHRVLPGIERYKHNPKRVKDFCDISGLSPESESASDRARYYAYAIGYKMFQKGLI
ncbi:hypothetical protein M4D58_23845 [Brevibacillus borstelensis]|uniref:hypothetical protein n=1 Tax=Brevibacillus borstelensis TaxID=45462 RepID=UPI002041CB6B|nr:hypothetical protein [Brevibacillus borstelensis]MCM3593659.1 hypothetical protein [Brevibacillus borstelensis]